MSPGFKNSFECNYNVLGTKMLEAAYKIKTLAL